MLFLNKNILVLVIVSISVLYSGSTISQSYAKINESYNNSEVDNYWLALKISTFLYLEYGIDHHVNVNEKSEPNQVDQFFRNQVQK